MDESTPPTECPECGASLAASGLCARCLMAGAAVPTEPAARAEGPDLERVASAFPQLEVLELIGRGGMGSVFKVRQPKLNRLAALKLLPHSLATDPAFAGRFEREAQVLARLNHPNIVAVYDYGQADGFFYLLMEFVDGVNLRQAMQAARFTPEQALGIVPKICEALQFAHDEGILHRDIKTENLLLDPRGRVKLADFGIAKLVTEIEVAETRDVAGDPLLTQAGSSLGTPSYMAPEQRESPADVDHRADIYSLGVVFYELLTGELPQQQLAAPSSKSAADPRIDDIVRQALESDRNFRQRSADEMKTQVETLGGLSPELKGGMEVAGSLFSLAAVALSFAGTSEKGRIEAPVSTAGVPVTVTTIGIGEPWLIEKRWMSAAPGELPRMVGGVHAAPSAWLFSEVAMLLAGVCWTLWFTVKLNGERRLDSKLDGDGGKLSFTSVVYLWLGALAFCQWLSFSVLGLMMFFRQEWDLPLPLQFIFKINFLVAALWIFRGITLRRWGPNKGKLPVPGPWPARMVAIFSLITVAGFVYATARSRPLSPPAPSAASAAAIVPAAETTDVHLELLEKTSVTEGEEAREFRQVAVISKKPGFLHLWADGHDPLVVPMLPDGSANSYRRHLIYSVGKAERPILHYRVITDNTQKEAKDSVDLLNRHVSFDQMAANFREIADPVGKCLRDVPLDLVPFADHPGEGSLWLAVTDTDAPPQPEPWYFHIWHPTYYTTPPSLPAGIATDVANIGEVMSDRGGQKLGRISQRDGRFMADLKFAFGSSFIFKGEMIPEIPVDSDGFFSGSVRPVRMVLTRKSEVISFLDEQVKLDQQKRKP